MNRQKIWFLIMIVGLAACSNEPSDAPTPPASRAIDQEAIELNNRGVGLMGRFDNDEARTVFTRLVEQYPDVVEFRINQAIATLNRQQPGDEENAMILLESILRDHPDSPRAQYCKGILLQRRGDVAEAAVHFGAVYEEDPNDAYAAYFLAENIEQDDRDRALDLYRRAIALNPYLRSAYYRAHQMLQRLGKSDEARILLDQFQRLEDNPRAETVEIKYTRMGEKAMAIVVGEEVERQTDVPVGELFGSPVVLASLSNGQSIDAASLTVADIDNDGDLDIFAAGLSDDSEFSNTIFVQDNGDFASVTDHPLNAISNVNAALWGDYDNDGFVDVYFCRTGPNQLWRQTESGWSDVTSTTLTANGDFDTINGAMFDADHDGDLDIFCVNADGPCELLNNNLDGTFRPLAASQGLTGRESGARQVLPVDLDRDRDLDLIVLNESPPHDVFRNDRLWIYESMPHCEQLRNADLHAVVAADTDVDGLVEIYGLQPDGDVVVFRRAFVDEPFVRETLSAGAGAIETAHMAIADFNGDAILEIVYSTSDGWRVIDSSTGDQIYANESSARESWSTIVDDPARGPGIVQLSDNGLILHPPGEGRYDFASIEFSGRTDLSQSIRSNASGIATHAAFRFGSHWTARTTLGEQFGPGQSLQPLAIGLAGERDIDFLYIDWSDGVFQSEIDLAAGELHTIVETQRQLSSCPVLFAWNGDEYEFVSDVLGVGGIGFFVEPGVAAQPRPWERFLMPPNLLQPRDGQYEIKLCEPMEEACYLDSAALQIIDVPPGWQVVIDERLSVAGPPPTGETLFYRDELLPIRATNDRSDDVTDAIRAVDRTAAPVGKLDDRFIGRLQGDHVLTLEFEQPLSHSAGKPALVIDGWVEYPYSQTVFAAWQADAKYRAPTLEARTTGGEWTVVYEHFGYPAGMPRRMCLPLDDLPAGATALRLTTNLEVYWDRLAVAFIEACPQAVLHDAKLKDARVVESGFARRTTSAQRLPLYDYTIRFDLWDTRHLTGMYTAFGSAAELVAEHDDALAIIGPGEEICFSFDAAISSLPEGWRRYHVFETRGWCKDMDLYTHTGDTLEPLPRSGAVDGRRDMLHDRYNTRYESGR